MGLLQTVRGPMIPYLMNNFSLPTILLTGACLQSLLSFLLPFRYAVLPAFFLLVARCINTALITFGLTNNPFEHGIMADQWTARIPTAGGASEIASDKGLVVFAIGASSNHPLGAFAPGFRKTGSLFMDLFKDIDTEPAKWGYLGKSSPLLSFASNPNHTMPLTTCTLTYWSSLSHLHAFAHAPQHREAWAWWDEYRRNHRDVGIYHETYHAPAGHWETIYENMQPFGLGNIGSPANAGVVVGKSGMEDMEGKGGLVRILKGGRLGSMVKRMGREEML